MEPLYKCQKKRTAYRTNFNTPLPFFLKLLFNKEREFQTNRSFSILTGADHTVDNLNAFDRSINIAAVNLFLF